MSYRLLDIDIDENVPAFHLPADEKGWAVLARRGGRPIAFWVEPLAPGTVVPAEAMAARIAREGAEEALHDVLRSTIPLLEEVPLPTLTIAICTRDRASTLARCLDGIGQLQLPDGLEKPQVLVVDNAPPDDATKKVAVDRAGVDYAVESIPGLNVARQRALEEARGDWIAFLDDDVVPDPTWLHGLAKAWRDHPDAAAITGMVAPLVLETEAQVLFELAGGFRRGCKTIRHGATSQNNPLHPTGSGIFGAGANMAYRREVVFALGGFDPALDTGPPLPGGGDLDIFYRVVRSGHVLIYEPSALVFHEHRRELEALERQYYSWGLGFMAYVRKHMAADPAMRSRFKGLVRWWLGYQRRNLLASFRGRYPLPPRMVMAELRGGIVGWAGEYKRSQSRMAEREREARANSLDETRENAAEPAYK